MPVEAARRRFCLRLSSAATCRPEGRTSEAFLPPPGVPAAPRLVLRAAWSCAVHFASPIQADFRYVRSFASCSTTAIVPTFDKCIGRAKPRAMATAR